jgi:kynurenine formamidase
MGRFAVFGWGRVGLAVGLLLLTAGCVKARVGGTPGFDLHKIVDLSYAFGPDTIYWPTAENFELQRVAYGPTAAGYWYAANNICMAEHGGTHMDAPIHFAEGGDTADQVPLQACIGPLAVIDVRAQAAEDADYRLTVADLTRWEEQHGRLPVGAIVLMWSGWGQYWGHRKRYLGADEPGDTENLHFPGFSKQAAEFLVHERDIAAIAVDTASIDHGPSPDFIVHQIINGANKPAFENVANVERLPPAGATFVALPLKIAGGSGAPARIIAILP